MNDLPRVARRAEWPGLEPATPASDLQLAGSSPGRSAPRANMGKLFTHLCLCSPSSINWYRRKLKAKQAFHVTHYLRVRGLAASAGVWLRAMETEISAAQWATGASGRTLDFRVFCHFLELTSMSPRRTKRY